MELTYFDVNETEKGTTERDEKEQKLLDEITLLHEKLKAIQKSREKKEKHRDLLMKSFTNEKNERKQKKKLINNNKENKVILTTRKLPLRIERVYPSENNNNWNSTNVGIGTGATPNSTSASATVSGIPLGNYNRNRRNNTTNETEPINKDHHVINNKWSIQFNNEFGTLDESLANYLAIYDTYPCIWVGMLDIEVEPNEQNELKEILFKEYNCVPVFVDSAMEDYFYAGYCKRFLWPLFHSTLPTNEDSVEGVYSSTQRTGQDADTNTDIYYECYKSVNQSFADVLQGLYNEGDVAVIVEYHFLLLPQMIRQLLPSYVHARIGVFIQLPFPSSELYRILTHRADLLNGILASDLIGFQTYEYARHFQSACVRLLGLEANPKGIRMNSHFAQISICPMGIVPSSYKEIIQQQATQQRIETLQNEFKGKKIILGVDVLDPTKGLTNKFLAIEDFFKQYPDLAKEVVFLQIAIPAGGRSGNRSITSGSPSGAYSRTHASNSSTLPPEYQNLGIELNSMAARINGKFHIIGGRPPIQYISHEISKQELIALYSVADVFLITSVCDGMNLLPFEYILCTEQRKGASSIVLSEFAGSARSLSGAILVNPWSTDEIAKALNYCLKEQKDCEKSQSHDYMVQYVTTFTANKWGSSIIEQILEATEIDESNVYSASRKELNRRDVYAAYQSSGTRLLLFTYEGVLAKKKSSIPELSEPSRELLYFLSLVSIDPANIVVIMSGHTMSILDRWFGHLGEMTNNMNITGKNIILAAEYGAFIKWSLNEPWRTTIPCTNFSHTHYWWKDVAPLLDYYSERTPGSYIERKEYGVTWHYRECDQDHGFLQATELLMSLRDIVHSLPVTVGLCSQSLEIRTHDATKAATFKRIWEYLNTSPFERSVDLIGDLYIEPSPKSPFRDRRGSLTYDSPTVRSRSGSGGSNTPRAGHSFGSASGTETAEIDFLFLVASGTDRSDEDLFEILVPPSVDLREYCDQIQKENIELESISASGVSSSSLNQSVVSNQLNDIPDQMLVKAESNIETMRREASKAEEEKVLQRPSSTGKMLSDSSSHGTRMKQADSAQMLRTVSENAVTKFPVKLLTPTRSRQEQISNNSRFKPRRDFPPSAALFHAMKKKYGKDFDMESVPKDAAAAWALVCPPNSRVKAESLRPSGTNSESSSSAHSVIEYEEENAAPENHVKEDPAETDKPEISTEDYSPVLSACPSPTSPVSKTSPRSSSPRQNEGYPSNTFLCTIGSQLSQAPYYIRKLEDLEIFLRDMAKVSQQRQRDNNSKVQQQVQHTQKQREATIENEKRYNLDIVP